VPFFKLLTIKVPTVKHKFSICDIESLEDHFHSDMLPWHIRQCEGDLRSAYTAPAVFCEHQYLWRDSDNVYIARRTLPYQWCPSFRCEFPFPDDGDVYATETCRSVSDPLKTLCHIS
jgi:hypothetical protein